MLESNQPRLIIPIPLFGDKESVHYSYFKARDEQIEADGMIVQRLYDMDAQCWMYVVGYTWKGKYQETLTRDWFLNKV